MINYKNNKILSALILLTLSLIWGSSFILIKKGLLAFTPMQVGALRITFAFLTLLPIAILNFKQTFKKDWKKYLALGLVANLIPASLFPFAEEGLASSLTGMLNSLTPIFTLLIGVLFFGTKMNTKQVLGLILGLAGALVLGSVNNTGGFGGFNYFALFVLFATLCYGLSSNMVKKMFKDTNTIVLTSLQMFSIGFFAIVYLLFTDFPQRMTANPNATVSLIYILILGVVNTAFALILFNRLIQLTSAVYASMVTYLIPLSALLWGLLDNEEIFPLHIGGMLLILFGVFIVNKPANKK